MGRNLGYRPQSDVKAGSRLLRQLPWSSLSRLTVRDDGVGFDLENARQSNRGQRGFGLTSMRERSDLLGGQLSMRSEVGTGTVVEAILPLGQ